jgi:hypothetical protein
MESASEEQNERQKEQHGRKEEPEQDDPGEKDDGYVDVELQEPTASHVSDIHVSTLARRDLDSQILSSLSLG